MGDWQILMWNIARVVGGLALVGCGATFLIGARRMHESAKFHMDILEQSGKKLEQFAYGMAPQKFIRSPWYIFNIIAFALVLIGLGIGLLTASIDPTLLH